MSAVGNFFQSKIRASIKRVSLKNGRENSGEQNNVAHKSIKYIK